MKKKYALLLLFMLLVASLKAQIITTTPEFPTEGGEITLVFDAAQGTKGLMGYTGDVYAHTGVITNLSTGPGDWKYAPTWGVNTPKHKLTSLGNNKWQLKITPDIRQYYGVKAGETIKQMVFVFRSATGPTYKEGKDVGGKDIFVDVYQEGLTVRIDQPATTAVVDKGGSLAIKASASINADMKLFVGAQQIAAQTNVKEITATHTFAQAGSFEVRVEATVAGTTEKASQTVNVLGETIQAALPKGVRPGINYPTDTKATLVLQAPKKKTVYVVGDFNEWKLLPEYQLKQDGEYFWITLEGLTKGAEYAFQYVVDGSIYIADPYADKILDPWNDSYIESTVYPNLKPYPTGRAEGIVSVLQTGQQPYAWQVTDFKKPAKEQLIAYELLIRDFTKEHSYNAAKEHLAYLKTLGVNAVELMPVNEFEGNSSWGYNPSFYFAADKYYGTKNDLKAFVDECHKQGLAVIIDLVLNHSFGQSPFYLMYRDSDGKPSIDNPWYNRTSNITNPGLQWGYDFNHESTYTRALVDSVASYWINEYQIDGFRYDFTKGFSNTPSKDEWANTYDPARVANLKRMNDEVQKRRPGAYVIFEHLAEWKEEKELGELGILLWRNMNNAYCETAMGWTGLGTSFSGLYAGTSSMPAGSLMGYMESHDEERTSFKAWKWGADEVKGDLTGTTPNPIDEKNLSARMKRLATNAAFCLTVPGPKMIWQFGEVGYDYSINSNTAGTIVDDYRTDPKPIRWDYYDVAERKALYDTYSKLLDLRRSYPELFASNATFSWKVGTTDWTNGRFITITSGSKAIVIVGNMTASAGNYSTTFPSTGIWYDYMNQTSTLTVTSTTQPQSLLVPAHEFRLYTNFQPILTGIEEVTSDREQPIAYYSSSSNELLIAGEAALVEVYAVNGTMVQSQKRCTSVGLSALPAGCYVARIQLIDGSVQTCKIVK